MAPAIHLVNSSTPYVYDERTRTYRQPEFSYELLHRFQQINSAAIQSLQLTKTFVTSNKRSLPVGTPLAELVNVGIKDHTQAPLVLEALLEEVSRQTEYIRFLLGSRIALLIFFSDILFFLPLTTSRLCTATPSIEMSNLQVSSLTTCLYPDSCWSMRAE